MGWWKKRETCWNRIRKLQHFRSKRNDFCLRSSGAMWRVVEGKYLNCRVGRISSSPHRFTILNFKSTPFSEVNIYTFPSILFLHTIRFFRRMLQKAQETGYININCVDPLGRSALLMAIDNENLEMVELLINHRVDTKDALLHAISEEFVEAVEVLLDHEDCSHRDGDPHVSNVTGWNGAHLKCSETSRRGFYLFCDKC